MNSLRSKTFACALLVILSASSIKMRGQSPKDPHRPACSDSQCRAARSFAKAHYCGESPYGNGPKDSCEIRLPKHHLPGIEVQADFACKWNDSLQKPVCQQIGHTIPEARVLLMREMHDAGLPVRADKDVLFSVLESASTGWSLMEANYEHVAGDKVTICQVIAVAKQGTEVQTIRKVAFQTTDADVPKVATWSLVDIADVSGKLGFILEGDAYEDHWLEVDEMRDGPFKTIFSGLGYYL